MHAHTFLSEWIIYTYRERNGMSGTDSTLQQYTRYTLSWRRRFFVFLLFIQSLWYCYSNGCYISSLRRWYIIRAYTYIYIHNLPVNLRVFFFFEGTVLVRHVASSVHLRELKERGCQVLHGVDVHTMSTHISLINKKFDIIIFNFPHAGHLHFYRETDIEMIRYI